MGLVVIVVVVVPVVVVVVVMDPVAKVALKVPVVVVVVVVVVVPVVLVVLAAVEVVRNSATLAVDLWAPEPVACLRRQGPCREMTKATASKEWDSCQYLKDLAAPHRPSPCSRP